MKLVRPGDGPTPSRFVQLLVFSQDLCALDNEGQVWLWHVTEKQWVRHNMKREDGE